MQNAERYIYIRTALDRRQDLYHAVVGKRRQRKQKPRNELAAHVAAQDILPRRELTAKFNSALVLCYLNALAAEELLVYADAALQ